jgi:hypothetical protein
VLAGMQRGSSVRSHHKGGAAGSSRVCALSLQPSAESRSHAQSAASTAAASSSSIAATASTWRRVLMEGEGKVYLSDERLQQPPSWRTAAGG